MTITFNNTVFGTGLVGEDDGSPSANFGIDNASMNNITINGTVTKVGDTVVATGLLPGQDDTGLTGTTNTLTVTQYDNAGQIEFAATGQGVGAGHQFRFVLSNTQTFTGNQQRVMFTSDPGLVNGTGPNTYSVACYAAGTKILTSLGDVAVERLRAGDSVVTMAGQERPIRWLGRQSYSGQFASRNPDVIPICFKAGSIADNVPARDLYVSPKHAMYMDGILIPAECLVNGMNVVRATAFAQIHYYHVELNSHDIILAEGALSESFIDDDSRNIFQNAFEHAALFPDERRQEAIYFAPRLQHGYEVEQARQRIQGRVKVDARASAA